MNCVFQGVPFPFFTPYFFRGGWGSPYVADSPNNRTGKDSAKGNLDRMGFS